MAGEFGFGSLVARLLDQLPSDDDIQKARSAGSGINGVSRNAEVALSLLPDDLNLKNGMKLPLGLGRRLASAIWFQVRPIFFSDWWLCPSPAWIVSGMCHF